MNVICILLDTLRRDHLGCYGNREIQTPNLDRFARNGALFTNAYLGSYPCMPARQDLWTGRLNFLWRGWSPLEHDQYDMITAMNRAGRTSMLVTDHYHLFQHGSGNYHFNFNGVEWIRGQEMDNWKTGSTRPITYPASQEKLNPAWDKYARNTAHFTREEDYFAAQVFQKSIEWVETNKDKENFFLMIDCFDPHEPFDPPPGYAERYNPGYTGESVIWPRYGRADRFTEAELKQIHALYCGEVTFVDRWFGKFYDRLERLGLLDNTMVIVTSDHGFLFGEHNWLGKHARILYQDIARTPLLIHHPQIKPGTVYDALVQMPDLTPTILECMDVEVPDSMHGRSLVPLWDAARQSENDIRHRESIIFGVFGGPVYCTDGNWLLVKKPNKENTPLYWYTHSHYQHWDFGQVNHIEDSIDRLSVWDGQRFPVQYENAQPTHAAPLPVRPGETGTIVEDTADELYHIAADPMQTRNLIATEPGEAERLRVMMLQTMDELGAPAEQKIRLELDRIKV